MCVVIAGNMCRSQFIAFQVVVSLSSQPFRCSEKNTKGKGNHLSVTQSPGPIFIQ